MAYTPNLKALQSATTLQDIAFLLKIKPSILSYHLYILDTVKDNSNKKKYKEFEIPKKKGGVRKILAPNDDLKKIQSSLSELLYGCIKEINIVKGVKGNLSYGYQKKISIVNNAKVHVNKRYVFAIDLKDFFDSINFGRVRGFFISNNNFGLDSKVATIIAQIACHNNILPQGSPCSPVISNLIGHILDIKLAQLASKCGCSYSRYCDDITFSTNKRVFPYEIAFTMEGSEYIPSQSLTKIINKSGFEINSKKVRMSFFYSQQQVTGLTVNCRVNTPRKYRDTVRALVHKLCITGDFEFKGSFKKDKINDDNKLDSLQGMLNYIARIEYDYRENSPNFKNSYPNYNHLTKDERVLKDYLMYRYFFNPKQITIFGEGKTDKSHLLHYLKFRAEDKQPLPSNFKGWKKIGFNNFENKLFNVISGSGGTADILKLIKNYSRFCRKYYKDKSQNPLIILVDNDKGSKDIIKYIQTSKNIKEPTDIDGFYFITNNMYVVFLPKINNQETDIESFYSEEIIDIRVDGRFFEKSAKSSSGNVYSKSLFATHVVPKHHELTDWSNFDQIFERIQLAIEDFEKRKN